MNKLNAVSAATGCLVVLFLLLSLLLPTWVVGSFKGDGHFGLVQFTVDLNMGDGLWKRNVCFGESAPENLLQKAGLSCSGTQQTKGCGAANLTDDKRKECRMFYAAQTLQILAVICAVLVCANVSGRVGFTLRVAFELVTACLAGMVLALLSHTYLYDNHERFSCSDVLGAELCYGYGTAYYLQALGIVLCLVRVGLDLVQFSLGKATSRVDAATPLLAPTS